MSGWSFGGREPTKLRRGPKGDGLGPSYLAADAAMETEHALAARKSLASDPAVTGVIKKVKPHPHLPAPPCAHRRCAAQFWENFNLGDNDKLDPREAGHAEYVRVRLLITKALVPVFETSDALKAAEAGWQADSMDSDGAIYNAFAAFLFEVADKWTNTVRWARPHRAQSPTGLNFSAPIRWTLRCTRRFCPGCTSG